MSDKPIFNEAETVKIKALIRETIKEMDQRYYTKNQILKAVIASCVAIASVIIGCPQIIPNIFSKGG